MARSSSRTIVGSFVLLTALAAGCSPYEWRHENQWESRDQIWLSEASQVKVRAAQSRVFDQADRLQTIQAVVSTCQDLGFTVEVLDETLGIVSGKKFDDYESPFYYVDRNAGHLEVDKTGIISEKNFGGYGSLPQRDSSYYQYRDDGLLILTRQLRSWGPFYHRSNLVRLTVTVRSRGDAQLVVRASAQYYLKAIESPEPYQQFFRTLEQALFIQASALP